jgi:hypothetical protein
VQLRRPILVFLVAALAFAGAACTSDDGAEPDGDAGNEPEATESPLPTRDTGRVEFERGAFSYQFQNVTATLAWEGGDGELTVENRSGRELGPPGLYAITDGQEEVPAQVADAASIPSGAPMTFTISFPDDLEYERMGMIVLLFGDENWGAFAPVPVEGEPAEQ